MRAAALGPSLLVVVLATVSAGIEAGPYETRFEQAEPGAVIVPVTLNGRGPFPFLLDTGSTHSSIAPDLADAIDAPPVARVEIKSVAGSHVQPVVRVDRLALGPATACDVLPSLLTSEALQAIRPARGIVGQDVLRPLSFTIDYRTHRIVWSAEFGPRSRTAERFTLEPLDGRFVVSLPQPGTCPAGTPGLRCDGLQLVPDSGTSTLLLFRRPGRPLPPLSMAPSSTTVTTLPGRGDARPAVVHELRIGGARLRDVPAVLLEWQPDGPGIDGLLPLHLFDRVTFDGPRELITLHRDSWR